MTRRRPARGRALAVLLLLAGLLGGGMVALHRDDPDRLVRRLAGGQAAAAPAQTAGNGSAPGQPAIAPPPESRFAVIALRPLFSPGRRPPDRPDSPTSTAPTGAPTDWLVTGIVLAGDDSVAIIEPVRPAPGAEPALVAHVGDSVSGWKIEAIEPGQVVLMRDGERHEMPLIDEDDPRRARAVRRTPAANQRRTNQAQPQLTPTPPQRQPQPQTLPLRPKKPEPE